MIQPGTPDQIPALKAIWAASFPEDPPEAIEDFFARCFRPEECLTAFEGGEPVSMAFLLPALYQRGGKAFPVQYIYAAATLPAWRGRGIFGALLRGALEEGRRRGQFASFLHPGEPSLAAYYGRFGYRAGFRAAVDRLNREEMLTAGGSAAGTAGARYHTVVQGDTLWAIAARNGTTVRALCALNPQIANPNRIYPGERVRLS